MKHVCLVIPPSPFLLDERVFVSLGVLKVAACLRDAGVVVDVLDLSGLVNFEDALRDYLTAMPADCIGFTATTPQFPQAARLARIVREMRPDARLIVGGPHATLTYAAVRRERKTGQPHGRAQAAMDRVLEFFDVAVCGDGETAVFRAVADDPPRIIDADDPKAGLFMKDADYQASPWPARDMVDIRSYRYSIEGEPATSLIAQLGCPFPCGFCCGRHSPMLRHIRMRSSDNIVAEIEHLHREYGFTGFMFYDDEMNVNRDMIALMDGIADLQDRLGVEFRLRGFIKSQLLNDAQAAALYRAGFRWLLVGFESGSDRILRNINKKANKDQNTRCIEIANRHGLKTKALMSIGHPGESGETVAETRQWLVDVRPDDFDATIITTYPGSPYYDDAVPSRIYRGAWEYEFCGDRLYSLDLDYAQTADYYKGDPDGGYRAYVFIDFLSAEDLVSLRDDLEQDLRAALDIPFNPSTAARNYEHSMGQGLPQDILRTSAQQGR